MPARIYDNLCFDKISVSNSHSVAINGSKVTGWGSDKKGKLDFPSGCNYVDVACGYSHSAAVTDDGLLMSVGNKNDGKIFVDSSIWHKSVRCSRNYTAAQVEVNGKDGIVVYGDQSQYSTLPSSLYSKIGEWEGVFSIPDVAQYDISDTGELLVVTTSTEMFTFSSSKTVLFNSLHRPVSRVMFDRHDARVMYLCNDGSAFSVSIGDDGNPTRRHLGGDLVSIFCGKGYRGWATKNQLFLEGEHYGNIQLEDGISIVDVWGGNNGYAITVQDADGNRHTVLCGANTVNKELEIKDQDFRECSRLKDSKEIVFRVRKGKEVKAPVVVKAVTASAESDYECEPCGYKFMSAEPKCPLCKCEVAVHV